MAEQGKEFEILITSTKVINSDSYIFNPVKNINSNYYIAKASQETINSDVNVLVADQQQINSNAYVKDEALQQTLDSNAYIVLPTQETLDSNYTVESIGATILVSPLDTSTANEPIYFTWQIPIAAANRPLHFEIDVATDIGFTNLLYSKRSMYDYAEFEYWDGAQWQAMPITGVASSYYGNNARINLSFTTPQIVYWRIRTCTKG